MSNDNIQPTQMEEVMNAIHKLTQDVGGIANQLGRVRDDVGTLTTRVGTLERPRPAPIRNINLGNQQPQHREQARRQRPPTPEFEDEEEDYIEDDEMEEEPEDLLRPRNRRVDPLLAHQPRGAAPRDPINDIKLTPISFAGKADPECYLEWERSMEKIFECYQYNELKKVAVAAAQLTGNASSWWDRTVAERRRLRFPAVTNWPNMKILMRARYVPEHFQRDLLKRFHKLAQGQRGVEEYYMEFEKLMNLLELEDTEEALMAQFIDGLQERIQRKVELMPYTTLVELYHLAVKVENQNKRKATLTRRNTTVPTQQNTTWQASSSRPQDKGKSIAVESRFQSKPVETPRNFRTEQGRTNTQQIRSRDVVCFKCQGRGHVSRDCPNNRVMILTQDGGYESQDEQEEEPDEPIEDVQYPDTGELLVIRRMLSAIVEPEEKLQRGTSSILGVP